MVTSDELKGIRALKHRAPEISEYVLQHSEKSFCPKCNKSVHLLCDTDMRKGKPAFYICFDCKYIGEIGIGVVLPASD